eukprot:c19068_g1_i1 orf=610-1287(-)
MVVVTMEACDLQRKANSVFAYHSVDRILSPSKQCIFVRTTNLGLGQGLQRSSRLSSERKESLQVLIRAKVAGKQPAVPLDEQLSDGDDLAKWQAARAPLLGFGITEQEANQVLAKSFGWAPSPYWGEEKAKLMPDPVSVQKTLEFLRSLGLLEADFPAFLKKFPEVLGCLVEEEMEKNVKILEKDWGISGSTLRNLLLRNPKVLGYNVDCKGDCMAQCTRCWVRF